MPAQWSRLLADVKEGDRMPQSPVPLPVVSRQTSLENPVKNESYSSGVSWGAVIGGAFVAASLALILLSLGTGLGLSSVSPWSNFGASAAVGKAAIAWLICTQIIASSMGGYLAGRLRTKWTNVHTDEVYFRDTAHGFLVWAVSLVITASLLATAATSVTGTAARNARGPANADTSLLDPNAYFVDTLLRSTSASVQTPESERAEVGRIFSRAIAEGSMPADDKAYLSQVVAAKAGLASSEAQNRVSGVFEEAQRSADSARKALGHLSLWLFVALLSGAFCASYAGTIGGTQRDHVS
jgi:hypothetical protein